MASDNEACCESDPNFAVICGFLEKFGVTCGLANIDFLDLQDMLENSQEVPQELVDLHVKLLRKARKSVSSERWERAIIKLCHGFCSQDAWEIERFGYKKARLSSKLRILKELLEMQFDYNAKFKNEVNKLSADELRTQPLGRDRLGHIYWFQSDNSCQIRVYKEDPDEETWALVAKNREGLVDLITQLNDGNQTVVNEDSNSLESEKPVVDTGQSDSNSNSNSSKQEPVESNLNPEEVQANTNKEEIEVEQPQVKSEEENAPNHAEVIKPTKIKLIGNKAIISDDLNKMAEPDNAITNIENNGNSVEEESKSESSVEKDEKDSKPLLTVTPPKTGISIRIKPITELISPSTVEVNKKVEITGVKEKYIRSDSTSSSSVHHRKAVDSAGFDVHTNYLKRPIDEEEDVEEPSYVKRPRLDRPTLLSNKKKKPYSDEEEDDEDDEEVSDEVKEPLMLVQGEGSGRDNETANSRMTSSDNTEEDSPIVGEAVEEEIVFFYGEGSGHACETGNDNNADKDAQQQNKSDADSTSGPSKLNPDDKVHEENKAEIVDSIKDSEPSNSFNENHSVKLSTKPEYKLGTIIDVRTNNLLPCVKNVTKKSRWDIGKPEEEIIESQSDGKASVIEEISDNICLAEEKLASLPLENVETKESQTLCNNNELLESETLKELDIREKAACDTNSVSCLNVDGLPPVSMKVAQEIGSKCEEEFSKNKEGQMVSSTEENKNENIDNIKTDTNSPDMTPKKSMFFFGPGCLQVKPTISPLKDDHSLELPEDSVEVDASPTKEIVNQDSLKLKSDDNVELKLETGKKEGNDNLVDTQHDISALNNEKNEEKEVKSVVLPVGSNETFTEVVVQERTVGAVDVKSDYDPQEFKKLSSQKSGEVPLKSINSPKMLDNETDLLKGEGSSLAVFKIPDSKKHFENLSIAENIPKLSEINQQDESTKAKIAQHVLLQNFTETSQTAETEKNTLINELELSAINQPATDEHAETKLTITNNSSEMVLKEDTNEPQVTKESPEIQKVEFINDDGQSNKLVAIKNSCSEQIKVNSAKEPLDIAADITESSPNFFKADPQTSKVEIIHDVLGVTSQNQSKSDMKGVIDHDSTKCNTNVEEPTEEDTREVLSATVVEAQVNKMHSSVPTSIKPANHHVPKSSISVSEKEIENLRTNSRKTGDKGGGSELNDVPVVDKPFSSHSSTHVENKKREKIVEATSLPICKNQVENLGITVKENKPKSKLENVLEKINQVKLIQKTDSIELNIKNKESLSLESKLKPHSTLLDSKTTSIEAQMAIITGEGLPDEHSIDSEMPKSSDIKIPSDIQVPTTSKLDIIAALENQNSTKNMIFATTLNSSITKEVAKVEVTACGNSSSDLEVKSVDTVLEASTKIVFPTNTDMPEEVSIKSTNTLCDIKENADVKPSTALSEVNKHVINQQTVDVPEQLGNTSISKLVTDKVVQNTIQQASVNSSPTSPVTKQVDAKTKPIDDSKNEQSNINKLNEMLDETSGDNKAQSDLEDLISKNSVLDKTLPSVDESKNHVKELVADTSHKNVLISKDIESSNTSTSDVKVTSKNNSAELALSSIKSPEQKIEIRQEVSIPENLLTVKKPEKTFVCTGSTKQLGAAIISDKPVIASTDKSVIGDSTIKLTTTKIVSTADVKTDNATLFNKQSLDTSAPTISDTTKTFGDTIVLDKPVIACTNKSTILQVTTPTKPAKYAKNVKKDNSDEQSLDITPSSSAITKELKDTTTSNEPIVISTDKSATLKDAIQCTPTKFVQAEDVKKDNSSLSDEHSLPTIPSSSVDVNSTVITKELKASVISDKPIITCTDKSVVLKDVIKSTPIKQGKAENVNKDNSALSSECSLDTTPSSTVSDVPTVITKELKDGITFNKPVTTSDECSIIKPTPTKLGRAETVKQDDSALSDKDSLDTIPSSSVCDTSVVITKELKAISADKSSILRIENVKKEDSALSDTPTSSIDYTTKVITKELKNIDKPVATFDDKSAVLKDTSKSTLTKPVQAENVKKDSLTLSGKNSLDRQTHNVGDTPARITEELKDTVVTSIGKSAVLKVTNKAIPTKPLKAEDVKKDDSTSSAKNSPDRLTSSIGDTPTILAGELKEATISNKPVATSADESAVVKDAIKMVSAKPMQTEDVMKKDDSALSKMVSAKPEDVIKKDDSALSQTISAKPEDVMQKDGSPVSKTISAKPVQAKDVMKKDDSALSKTVSAKPVQAKDVMKKDDSALSKTISAKPEDVMQKDGSPVSKTISAKPVQAKDVMKKDDSALSKTVSAKPVQAKDVMKKDDSALSKTVSAKPEDVMQKDDSALSKTISVKPEDVMQKYDSPLSKIISAKYVQAKDVMKKDDSAASETILVKPVEAKDVMKKDDSALFKAVSAKPEDVMQKYVMKKDDSAASKTILAKPVEAKDVMKKDDSALSKAVSAKPEDVMEKDVMKKDDSAAFKTISAKPMQAKDIMKKDDSAASKTISAKPEDVLKKDDSAASKTISAKPVEAKDVLKKDDSAASKTISAKPVQAKDVMKKDDSALSKTVSEKPEDVTQKDDSALSKTISAKPVEAKDVQKKDYSAASKTISAKPVEGKDVLKKDDSAASKTISAKPVEAKDVLKKDDSAASKTISAKPVQAKDVMKKDDSALSKTVSAKPEDVTQKDDSALSKTISAKPVQATDIMKKDDSATSKTILAKPVQAKDVMKKDDSAASKTISAKPENVTQKDDSALSKTISAKPVEAKDVLKKDDSAASKTISAKPVQAKDIIKKDDSAASKTISATPVQAKDIMKKDDSALSNQHSLDQPGASAGDTPAVIAKEVEDNTVSDKPVVPSIDKDTIKSTPTKPSKRKDIVKKDNSTVSDKRSRDTSAPSVGDTPTVISKELEKTIILDSPTASTDKSATLKEVIKSATKKPGSSGDVKKDNSTVSGKRLRSRTSTSSVGNVTSVDNSAVTDLPTDNFPNKIRLNKRNKQSLEKVCESKPKPPAKVVIESSRNVSTSIKNEKSEVISEKSLNEKELLQTKVEAKTSVLGSSSDNLSKSDSKNDNIKAVVQSEEKILSRRITRRTRSSTLEKPPEVVSSVNKEVSSVENVISTSLSKLEETKIKANLPQVCITKIDINDLNENASISIANIEKSAGIAESGTELRKRGRVATQPQNSDIKPRPRGRPSLKKNKLLTENSEELKTPTDEEKSAKPVPKSNKKEVEVVGGNIRELRGRKGMEKSKVNETEEKKTKGKQLKGKLAVKTPAKEGSNTRGVGRPKGKNNNETPSKPNEPNEVRSFTRSRAQITKDKEITSKIETGQENTKKPENTNSEQNVDLGDIEEQIVRNEIRPSKKLKLADSVEVTVIDKNKRTVTTHVADKNKAVEKVADKNKTVEKVADKNKTVEKVADKNKAVEKVAAKEETEDKKEPVKLRRTSNRLSVSGKTESSEKNSKDQNTSIKQEERLHGSEDKKVDVEKQEPKTKSSESKEDNSEELKPVVEPKCIQKKVALLTSVENKVEEQKNDSKCELLDNIKDDIKEKIDVTPETNADVEEETSNIKTKSDDMKEELENIPDSDVSDGIAGDCGDSSDGMGVIPESDPLGGSDEDSKGSTKNSEPMTLATFKIDLDESSPASIMRVTRKRAAQQSIDALRETRPRGKAVENESKNIADNKRAKLKRKRSVDRNLRRSIEEKKSKEISSSEEDAMGKMSPQSLQLNKEEHGKKIKAVVKRRISTRSTRTTESPALSSDALSEASRTDTSNTPPVTKQRKPRRSKKTLLGLEISPETEDILKNDTLMGVRQSRRIAQIKIKEEAERRKLEEVTLYELKEEQRKRKGKKDEDKDYKLEKHKRNKIPPTEDETTTGDAESDEKKKRKRKRKHRDPRKHFDALNPWKSSSGSSSSEVEEEEDEIEEEDDSQLVFKSDHEFSPESDLEEGGEVQPLKRARTARKESDAEEEVDDCACQKCGQKDHPEWILLCDSCDCGWHCSCLRPALLVIPEGDWFCPPCQHITLVKNLETQLLEYDKRLNKKEMETRRKERLAYVGISLDNVLPSKESEEYRIKRQHQEKENHRERNYSNSDSDDSGSDSDSSSNSSSDSEPIYQLRERRQAHSYRFNDYDELINSAIQDELDAVKGAGNQGRGKDIATIVNAEKEEEALRLQQETTSEAGVTTTDGVAVDPVEGAIVTSETGTAVPEPLPPVVPVDYDKKPEDSDDEIIRPVRKIIGKKKHRKLNSLDVSSGDDAESDEDFKGSSSSDSEEDFDDDEYTGTDSSGDRRGKRRKDFGPVRRSTRARISRYDRDFINDDDTDSDDAPRRKKTRSVWDESESEESDRSWGRRKRKAKKSSRKKPSSKVKKSKKKKKKRDDDSDPEVYRKRPNIKFGGLNDDEEIGRRTRGKKINYLEALGTDSEEEIRKKPPRIEESEEEYFLHEDADFQHQLEDDKDSDESGVDAVLQDLAVVQHATSKPRGRGKSGLKIPRKPKEPPPPDLFPPLMPDVPQLSNLQAPSIPTEPTLLQPLLTQQPLITQPPLITQSLLLEPPMLHEHDLQEIEDEPNPIEQINKNVEQMNEQEMEKMMEEEDYANKQLQLVALQIEKEKKRKEREAKRLEKIGDKEQKIPKKRGRKPKSQTLGISTDLVPPFSDSTSLLLNSTMANNAELSEPPGVNLPMFSEIAPVLNADGSPKKRRGRGKGKKTLAAEAAAIAAAAAANKDSLDNVELGLEGPASSGSNTVSPAPESPLHGSKLGIATPPQPFSQSQPTPSVITRMLQSQPGQGNFPAGVAKYFGGPPGDPQLGPPTTSPYHPGATGPRGQIPGPYQQPPGMSHYPVVRSGPPPPHRLHSPGPPALPPMYHTHRSLDPSPSGGGPINVPANNRDRHSPAVVPPASSSPLSKGDPTPPPPPYTRPQVGHFPPVTGASSLAASGSRHIPMVAPHLQQHRTSSMSPYHPGVPPNYHYGSYPPPPPLNSEEGQPPPGYPSSAYPEPYPAEGAAPVQPPEGSGAKSFDEETSGEFVGLVSYFSSQREDDLDT